MRKPIIAGNWKMHLTLGAAQEFVQNVRTAVPPTDHVESVICAPFIHLPSLVELTTASALAIGAQNMHFKAQGAFTGEISPAMLADIGVAYVIIGHSERRQYFRETCELVNLKAHAAFENQLVPIICVGEHLEEREAQKTETIVRDQVQKALTNLSAEQVSEAVIAYEPIWAIGSGKASSAEEANQVISYIRSVVRDQFDASVAESVRIQYGGSVNPENIASFMAQPDIDGALVGGASLKPDSFVQLIEGSKR